MLELVKEYPPAHQPEYLAAAKSWRFPYWDWAAKKQVKNVPTKCDYTVPQIVLPKTVPVEVSRGSWTAVETIPNPMYAFHSPDDIPMGSPVYGDNGLESDGGFHVSIFYHQRTCFSFRLRDTVRQFHRKQTGADAKRDEDRLVSEPPGEPLRA